MCPIIRMIEYIHEHFKHTYWISYVLPSRNNDAECEQDYWANGPMKSEYWWIDVNMWDLDQGL